MKTPLIHIGNSRGVRLPKPVIEQCGFSDEVELDVQHNMVVIRSLSRARQDWSSAFERMHQNGDDHLLDADSGTTSSWDQEEWEW